MTDKTHFGYQEVPEEEKASRVASVFDSVARRYDLMNDLMSVGLHRYWKRFATAQSMVRPGERVLDVAGGTGDLARLFAERVGPTGTMTHKDLALGEFRRVLRAGGRLLVLEFSRVWRPLERLYDLYSFQVLPRLGQAVAGDAESYRYLAESIRMHPDQETLRLMIERAGFDRVEYANLAAGVVALHRAVKY
jgi:demethylmenaquinone methyltransferase/2-methoxy-6-polyprenyl-1,4-benzoquinol methylase